MCQGSAGRRAEAIRSLGASLSLQGTHFTTCKEAVEGAKQGRLQKMLHTLSLRLFFNILASFGGH